MPFIESSYFEKQEKQREIAEKIERKRENKFINENVDETKPKSINLSDSKVMKQILKGTAKGQQHQNVITLKDLKEQMKIDSFVETEKKEEIINILNNQEVIEIKNGALNVMAMTHFHPIKRQIFAQRLQNSGIVNEYVNNNLIYQFFNKANASLKFGVVYGVNYLQTNDDYNRLCMMAKNAKNDDNTKQPIKPETETENKPPTVIQEHEEPVVNTDPITPRGVENGM